MWDATCRDTLAPSHLSTAERGPGLVAAEAESQKWKKYSSLGAKYCFVPIACESLGVFGAETFKDLGHRLHQTTGDSNSYQFLLQRLSVAIQRGNSTSVLGTLSFLQHKVEKAIRLMEMLEQLDVPQVAYTLLRNCVSFFWYICYYIRIISPPLVKEVAIFLIVNGCNVPLISSMVVWICERSVSIQMLLTLHQ